ncbi:MAG: DUF4416 family protein [Chitinispirillaceae bacterium]|nr:DUF4416 family protein [Chitinispirillaceae bacterium]
MGTALKPPKVKLMIAFLYHEKAPVETILRKLDERFGRRQFSVGPVPFTWTGYYRDEMGEPLRKLYFNYQTDIGREVLPSIKTFTNKLECSFTDGRGNRRVNIDPGYVARDKVVLATTKDFYHRMYLADGIFGEVTLHYRKGRFRYFSWTYPDFRDPAVMRFLERVRAPLVKELRDDDPFRRSKR